MVMDPLLIVWMLLDVQILFIANYTQHTVSVHTVALVTLMSHPVATIVPLQNDSATHIHPLLINNCPTCPNCPTYPLCSGKLSRSLIKVNS